MTDTPLTRRAGRLELELSPSTGGAISRFDFFGENGLGLGVCGNWAHQDGTSGDVRNRDNFQSQN